MAMKRFSILLGKFSDILEWIMQLKVVLNTAYVPVYLTDFNSIHNPPKNHKI